MTTQSETRPREYASQILRLNCREARIAALAAVPAHLRPWVRDYVVTFFERLKAQPEPGNATRC